MSRINNLLNLIASGLNFFIRSRLHNFFCLFFFTHNLPAALMMINHRNVKNSIFQKYKKVFYDNPTTLNYVFLCVCPPLLCSISFH